MFTTWRYTPNSKDDDGVVVGQRSSFDPTAIKTNCPKACSWCRGKKLKCSGEWSGCQRCKAHGRDCDYVETVRRPKAAHASRSVGSPDTRNSTSLSTSLSTSSATSPLSNDLNEEQSQDERSRRKESTVDDFLTDLPNAYGDLSWMITPPPGIMMDLPSSTAYDYNTLYHGHPSDGTAPIGPTAVSDNPETGSKSHEVSSARCQCLYRVVMAMDQLAQQDEKNALDKKPISLLVLQKEALGLSTNMTGCIACTGRVENMMILAILLDKLARVCHRVVLVAGDAIHPVPPTAVSLGDYPVDPEEYATLILSLLRIQLLRLQGLLKSLQQVSLKSDSLNSETLAHRLAACAELVAASLERLRDRSL